ncbi:hypothetical protein RN001_009436 [Aquatica leii]|uniref:t-SNARE coiled-coil homology domain-containing protein n=1 Tax=Aquatica leii TaxID=1421715 RepID=A0AAN7SPX9_9COLE|nr:hypothetical protein RN001_009436 [Aquatica leii]
MLETEHEKRPYIFIKIPLNKFRDEVIPHHQSQCKTHKNTIEKFISSSNYNELQKEIKQQYPILRQLKNYIYELEALKMQVIETDLERFDSETTFLKKEIYALIQNYLDLETYAANALRNLPDDDLGENISQENCQLLLEGDFLDLQLYDKTKQLERLEALNKDIDDVHHIFGDLHQMLEEQKESVNVAENNVDLAGDNTKKGLKQLIRASKYKVASFPVAGACIGTMIGGPIGSIAGLKIGAIAAIGFGVVGYASGKFIRKKKFERDLGKNEMELVNQVAEPCETKKMQ